MQLIAHHLHYRSGWWAVCFTINYVASRGLKVKKAVIRIHRGYELLIRFISSIWAKHTAIDWGHPGFFFPRRKCKKLMWVITDEGNVEDWALLMETRGRRTCQCEELLQLSVSAEGERGSAEPLLSLHGRVWPRLLHPHQLSCGRHFLIGALQKQESQRKGSRYCSRAGRGSSCPMKEAGTGITLLKCQMWRP